MILSRKQIEAYRDGLFFIVGNSRAGSTMLQGMLSSHSSITIPPETHYFSNLHVIKKKFGDNLTEQSLEPALRYILRPEGRLVAFGLDVGEVLATFRSFGSTYEDLFVVLVALYAERRKKPIVGEKTPRHLLDVCVLEKVFPRANFIALFRDPRAVAASEIQAQFGSPSVFVTARRWARFADVHEQLARAMSADRYRMIRYEELVAFPRERLEDLCEFLGVGFQPAMLEFHRRPRGELGYTSQETSWKKNTREPLMTSRVEAWRTELSSEQVAIIERTVGPRLQAMGYSPAEKSVTTPRLVASLAGDLASSVMADLIRSRRLKRKREE